MSSNLFSQPLVSSSNENSGTSGLKKRRNSAIMQHFDLEQEENPELKKFGPSSAMHHQYFENKDPTLDSAVGERRHSKQFLYASVRDEDKVCVQMEDIIEAPGHLTTHDSLFDVFKRISLFMTDRESFESGLACCCKSAREAVLQNHFLGRPSIINSYLTNWIVSKGSREDVSRKELPDLFLRFNNALFVHMNPILLILSAQHGCEAIVFDSINHPFLTFSIFRNLSIHDIGELMQFTEMKFYSIFHPVDLFSILLCESINCDYYNLATTLYNHHFASATCPLHAKEKVSKLETMLEIALERDLPRVYFFILEKLVEMKRLYIEELTGTYNRLSQELDSNPIREILEGEDATPVGWVPIIEEEEQEMELSVEKKLVQRFFHTKFKHFILDCPRIFNEGFLGVPKMNEHILQVLKRFVGHCASKSEREFIVQKLILALVRNLDKDLPYVIDSLSENEMHFSYRFVCDVFGDEGVLKNGILKSVHIFKTVGNLLDREKMEFDANQPYIFSVDQLKRIFEEMEFRHNFVALEYCRKKLLSYRDKDLI